MFEARMFKCGTYLSYLSMVSCTERISEIFRENELNTAIGTHIWRLSPNVDKRAKWFITSLQGQHSNVSRPYVIMLQEIFESLSWKIYFLSLMHFVHDTIVISFLCVDSIPAILQIFFHISCILFKLISTVHTQDSFSNFLSI